MPPRQTVLIVEDDTQLRGLYRTALSCAGYTVHEAADGIQALQHLDRNPPTAVVLDLMLPGVSGAVVRQEMAANTATRKIPIVVVTGAPGNHDRLNVACVLKKPVSADQLVKTVRECLTSTA